MLSWGEHGKIEALEKAARRSPPALAALVEAVFDGGGFDAEEGILPARALAQALAGHLIRQTQCLEAIAHCAMVDHKAKLWEW